MDRRDILGAVRDMAGESTLHMQVSGLCMTPALSDGQTVTVRRAAVYWPGDVVAVARDDGSAVAHRVLGYRWHRGRPALVIQADRGDRPDPPVPLDHVIGRVDSFVSPVERIGAVTQFARHTVRWLRRR